ncbi:hypothetical protein CLHOM_07490 [Clostridium homopropionicum DSM 5847]|uniref:SbsA Ig-like domain-containing protein n=1 Tax=Clostridium homopropionicum DSM 5847 TaxID=1121318 RepID=A0A0L6ZCC9_9CLOT|nr:Ig-like domain-containing protein [Clostridium homopropionicum]KOA20607.1 hypothetical protein CLHOM_07490 [Clostridium homopropionicum DSM 5847]SFF93278.1 Ig-like domain-containing protein [Clostridium homopropionicum]
MANKKVVSVLSTAAIGTLIATAVGSTVFAAVDGLVVKNAAGSYLNYDLDALKASVVNDALGQAGAELYKDFDAARTAGSIVSYHDNKVGFVDAAAVQKAALDAALAGTNFALDTFTESSTETVLPATVYQATVTNGKVVAGAEVKPTTSVTSALAVQSVSAINTNSQSVALDSATNVQANATFSVVLGTEVDPATVASANIKLYSISATTGAATQVGLTGIGLDTNDTTNKTIVARPATYLTKATKYKLVITTGLKDKAGNALAANKEVSFTTDSSSVIVAANGITTTDTGLAVTTALTNSNVPANDLQVNDYMTVTYDTTLDASTVNNSNVRVKDLTLGTYIVYTPSVIGGNAIRLTWTAALTTGHQYQVEINNVKTAIGDPVANNVIKFVANDTALTLNALTAKDLGDDLTLAATRLYPKTASGMYGTTYKQGVGFVLTLNGKADPATVIDSNIYLTQKDKTEKIPVTISYNKDEGNANSVIRITPAADLTEATNYTLHIGTGVKTIAGTAVATEITQNFKTADLTAPQILGVDGIDTVQSGVANKIVIHFSEAVASATNADAFQALVANITGAAIGNTNPISITDLTTNVDGDAAGILNRTELSTDGKDLTLTVTPTVTNRAYRIRIAARNTTTAAAYITDANNTTAGATLNTSIPSTYDVVFTTAKDNVKPAVTAVTKTSLAGTAVTSGVTNLANNQVLVFKVGKQLDATMANAAGTQAVPAANAKLVNLTTGAQLTLNAAGLTLVGQNPAGVTYSTLTLTLPGAAITEGKYELTLTGLKDTNGNVQDGTYTFDFTVDTTVSAVLDTNTATQSYVYTAVSADGILDGVGDTKALITNQVGVLVNSPIYVKFNEVLTGLDATSVVLTKDSDGTVVEGAVVVDADGQGVKFTPAANLANNTAYKLTIKKSVVKDNVGNPLTDDINVRFKTVAATTVPTVTYSVKTYTAVDDNSVNRDTAITLTFNGVAAAAAGVSGTYTLTEDTDNNGVFGNAGDAVITVKPVLSTDSKSVVLYPDTALAASTNYQLTVNNTLTVDGVQLNTNALAVTTQTFKTNALTDATSTVGVQSAKYDSTNKTLVVTFDRPVDAGTAGLLANYTITGGNLVIVGANGIVSGNTVTFVVDTTNSVIVPNVTTIAAKAAALYQTSGGTSACGTGAAVVK